MSTGILFLLLNVAKLVDFVSTYEFENPKNFVAYYTVYSSQKSGNF